MHVTQIQKAPSGEYLEAKRQARHVIHMLARHHQYLEAERQARHFEDDARLGLGAQAVNELAQVW